MEIIRVEKQIGKLTLSFETGYLAKQAAGACLTQYGDTVVLTAAATGPSRPGTDFFPLTCDYRERTAAAGKFPGGFIKREGRPTTKEILTCRLMDRPIRPMFPKGFRDEVQVMANVLSSDRQNDGDVLAMNGAAVALGLSSLPFDGPLAAVRLAHINDEFVVFPTHEELEESDLDLIISGNKESVLMIEGFSREMPEDIMLKAIETCHEYIKQICDMQLEFLEKAGAKESNYEAAAPNPIYQTLVDRYYNDFKSAKQTSGKQNRAEAVKALKERVKAEMIPDPNAEDAITDPVFKEAWHDLDERIVRDLILAGTRPDGRDGNTLRAIECKVDVLPRVHGSAVSNAARRNRW